MERALRDVRQSLGLIKGVVHAAGILDDALFTRTSQNDWQTVAGPKVDAALALDKVTQTDALSWFIVCSGLAGRFGNAGQAIYGSANAWLDAWAEDRQQRVDAGEASGTTRSIAWPLWDTPDGMQASQAVRSQITAAGLELLTPDAGLNIFARSLDVPLTTFAPIPGPLSAAQRVFLPGQEQTPANATATAPSPASRAAIGHDASARTAPRAAASQSERMTAVLGLLTAIMSDVTETDPSRIDHQASLDVYGLDSILVMEMSNKLNEVVPTLAKTALFEARSLHTLAELIVEEHPADVDQFIASKTPQATVDTASVTGPYDRDIASPTPVHAPVDQSAGMAAAPPTDHPPAGHGQAEPAQLARDDDIAIIGVAGRYPGSRDLSEFWDHLAAGHDLVTELPDRLANQISPADREAGLYARWGSFLDDVECFDPLFFGIAPRDAERIDPQERLFLQTAWHTLEDAGYTPQSLSGARDGGPRRRVGVTVGVMYGEYQFYGARHGAASPPTLTNSSYASIANRVSFCFDFDGPSFAVDSMCSSSLTSIHLAMQLIRSGDCDVAIAGGVNLSLHPYKYRTLCDLKFAATDGQCRSFGEGGDGYVPGEGVGAVLLKPVAQAMADGDHIYAVIKGSSVGHGARTAGYTVPNAEAQAAVIANAFERADVPVS
ncbi:MAG: beta-ketoacyl synthase N-terminal-like domain-containing protein, partial [Pseudomonadota bacterium]